MGDRRDAASSGGPPPGGGTARPTIQIPSLASTRPAPPAVVAPGRTLDPAAAALLGRPPPPPPPPREPDVRAGTGVFSPDAAARAAAAPPPPPRTAAFPPPAIVLAGGGNGGTFAARTGPPLPSSSSSAAAHAADAGSPSLAALLRAHPHSILVARRQDGNPILAHLRATRWVFADIAPDYVLSEDAAAMFVSLRFHLLHPSYAAQRCAALKPWPRLKLLLCHVDVEDPGPPLTAINVAAARAGVTLLCAFSAPEAARYLELLRAFAAARTPADAIAGRVAGDYVSRLGAALTTVRGVTKADVVSLGTAFGSAAALFAAPRAALEATPGVGPTKAARLAAAFGEPFFGGTAAPRQTTIDAAWKRPTPAVAAALAAEAERKAAAAKAGVEAAAGGQEAGAAPAAAAEGNDDDDADAWNSAAAAAAELDEGGVDGGGDEDG